MKYYKATYSGRCLTQTYEVGKTYTANKLEMCHHGFHFCDSILMTTAYYDVGNPTFKMFEVEPLGKIISDDKKYVTDRLKIVREVPLEDVIEVVSKVVDVDLDDNGRIIKLDKTTYKYHDDGICEVNDMTFGINVYLEYLDGFLIYKRSSDGTSYTWTYDNLGRLAQYVTNYMWSKKTTTYTYDIDKLKVEVHTTRDCGFPTVVYYESELTQVTVE